LLLRNGWNQQEINQVLQNFISQNRAQTTKQTNPTFKLRNYKIPTSWEYFFCDREKVESYGDLGFIVAG